MQSTGKMMDELRAALADAEELLRASADQAGPRVEEARRRAEESLRAVREQMEGAGRDLDAKVRENPWAAVGIAAAIGLLAGVLLSRRS